MLLTSDGVRVRVRHLPPAVGSETSGSRSPSLAIVVAHGFTGSLDRPAVQTVMTTLRAFGGVIGLDFRGHGRSSGTTTVGDREIFDLDAAVDWGRTLGYDRIATVGFSMGGAVALRHAALLRGVDAVVSVSAPAWWHDRNTVPMRRVHWLIETRTGRLLSRTWRRTRIDHNGWIEQPLEPFEVIGRIGPTPVLVVQGTADPFFGVIHGQTLYDCANEPRELWLRPGLGHAEVAAVDFGLLGDIGRWVEAAVETSSQASA